MMMKIITLSDDDDKTNGDWTVAKQKLLEPCLFLPPPSRIEPPAQKQLLYTQLSKRKHNKLKHIFTYILMLCCNY